jgi:excisionase family DNA binding protein
MERLLNIDQVSDILSLRKTTLYEWVEMRRIPFVRLGKRILFDPNDIRGFIEQNRIEVQIKEDLA